ncbi:MAG: signal peptidase I [Oscillospiraceae bacterium]|nr:signal peptidase I [Oscillospiraceae bacterium]
MTAALKKIWNIVSTALVVLMVLCAVFLMGSRLLGYQVFTVISGSMEPKYSVGDLLYVKKVDVNTIQVGDDITFLLNEDLVVATHQVIRIDAEKQRFYTKGLANEIEDSEPVHFNNVLGVPQFSIPKLGYVSNFIQNPPGTYITIAAGALLILLVFLPDLLGRKEQEQAAATGIQAGASAAEEENRLLRAEVERLRGEIAEKKTDNTQ